jgi:DNA-binding NarL/FixJ family response regulator
VKVLIAEDHPMFRDGLAALIGGRPGISCVHAVSSGSEAIGVVEADPPDVAVVDLRMPDGDGIWLISSLVERFPKVRILVLTSADDDRSIAEALAAGAHGYLLKSAGPDEIAEAVTAVATGTAVLSDDVLAVLSRRTRQRPLPELTDREFDVLEALAVGRTTDSTARHLGMSVKTVRNHVSNVLNKLGVQDRTAAVVVAHRHGVGIDT